MARLVLQRLRGPILSGLVLVVVSTAGYVVFASYSWFDGLYMTAITLGTIGYGEVQPLDHAGRLWTMSVILAGFAELVYSSATLTSLFVSGDIAALVRSRKVERMKSTLHGHVVVVGFGRVGRAVTESVRRSGRGCAVIDLRAERRADAAELGAVFVEGDGREVEVLTAARIEEADALVSVLDDPSNLVVVVTARSLRPDLRIVARSNDQAWNSRLLRAGAAQVVPVYESVGASLAASAVTESVVAVQDLPGVGMRTEELVVPVGSPAIGNTLAELMAAEPEVLLLGVRQEAGGLTRWHELRGPLAAGDVLVALGPPGSLTSLAVRLAPVPAAP